MAIKYAPQPGSILLCQYSGEPPEMVKRRPVVVLASVAPHLAIVVPLSTTWPIEPQPWHYLLRLKEPLSPQFPAKECWAKCDMISAVSFDRLKVIFKGKDSNGKRRNVIPKLSSDELEAIRTAVMFAIRG